MTFTYEHDTQELPVWIDRDNFDKVIVNLLSNAFKFTPAGGEIKISITHDKEHVRLAIKDTGEGIPEDKLDRIFERFYQSPSHVMLNCIMVPLRPITMSTRKDVNLW